MKKMKIIKSSLFRRLPDEILLEIFRKLIDLKTLCLCRLVCRRFYRIVRQVDTISYTAPLVNPTNFDWNTCDGGFPKKLFWYLINGVVFKPLHLLRRMVVASTRHIPSVDSFYCDSFRSAVSSLRKFTKLKSLCIQLPSSRHKGVDDRSLFKWKVKFGTRVESYYFLWPTSICHTYDDGNGEEEVDMGLERKKHYIAFQCLMDVMVRHRMLLGFIYHFPLLEKVSVTDYDKRGRVSLSCGEIGEVRNWLRSSSATSQWHFDPTKLPRGVSEYHVPLLHMPVSGYVMKGLTLVVVERNDVQGGNHGFMNNDEDGFEDKEEAAYGEAMMEILKKQMGRIF